MRRRSDCSSGFLSEMQRRDRQFELPPTKSFRIRYLENTSRMLPEEQY